MYRTNPYTMVVLKAESCDNLPVDYDGWNETVFYKVLTPDETVRKLMRVNSTTGVVDIEKWSVGLTKPKGSNHYHIKSNAKRKAKRVASKLAGFLESDAYKAALTIQEK